MANGILKWVPGVIGAILMLAAQVHPDTIASNLAAWSSMLGLHNVPYWLKSESVDSYALWIGITLFIISIILVVYTAKDKATQKTPVSTEDNFVNLESREKELVPDWRIGEAIEYVVNIQFPDKEQNIGNIDTEDKPAAEVITEKIKSGDLQTWGNRVGIKMEGGARNLKVNIDQEQFSLDDWQHRGLLPLEASISTEKTPQTQTGIGTAGRKRPREYQLLASRRTDSTGYS